ncbi:AMP-binding protein [Pseudoclavibacter endophyticus]|uniref:AMP-binding protein n=1 Tax=Pseudoclavibacter endophyticus TaxID=1778590 RepID=UPI00166A40B8|nr:AMP-binding protein [Pseudoclavibacter endophyticus]
MNTGSRSAADAAADVSADNTVAWAPHYSDLWQGIAARTPERRAVVTPLGEVTWGQLAREAGAVAAHLTRAGLVQGDAAATLLYNRAEFLTFLWACLSIGVAPVAINYRYRATEVRELLVDSNCRSFLFQATERDLALEAADGLDIDLIEVDDEAQGSPDARQAPKGAGEQPVPRAAAGHAPSGTPVPYADVIAAGGSMPATAPSGACMRLYTGGTTGSPKAVVWDLDTLLVVRRNSTWGLIGAEPPTTFEEAVDIACDPTRQQLVTLPMSPLLHGTAQSATMATLAIGGCVVLQGAPRMDVQRVYELIREHRVNRVIVAGDVLALPLVEAAEAGDGLPDVTSIISSGMRLSADTKRRLHAQGDMTIVDMFASSEGGPYALGVSRSADEVTTRMELTPDAVILDAEHRALDPVPGTVGLIAFRGILPTGYFGDPVKTASSFPVIRGRRHLVPGDWVRVEDDGRIELLGRGRAVVNTGGEKVFPAEVEQALLEHDAVSDAVVFGMPHPRYGEVVCAAVAVEDGADVTGGQLSAFVGQRLAGYKKPKHVFLRTSLDRSVTGKIPLERLRDEAAAELGPARA